MREVQWNMFKCMPWHCKEREEVSTVQGVYEVGIDVRIRNVNIKESNISVKSYCT